MRDAPTILQLELIETTEERWRIEPRGSVFTLSVNGAHVSGDDFELRD